MKHKFIPAIAIALMGAIPFHASAWGDGSGRICKADGTIIVKSTEQAWNAYLLAHADAKPYTDGDVCVCIPTTTTTTTAVTTTTLEPTTTVAQETTTTWPNQLTTTSSSVPPDTSSSTSTVPRSSVETSEPSPPTPSVTPSTPSIQTETGSPLPNQSDSSPTTEVSFESIKTISPSLLPRTGSDTAAGTAGAGGALLAAGGSLWALSRHRRSE